MHTSVLADCDIGLAHLIIHASCLDLGDEDVVGSTGNGNALRGNLSEDTDGNARTVKVLGKEPVTRRDRGAIPGEGVAHHEISMNAQLLAKLANLVLEHLAQGFDEFKLDSPSATFPRRYKVNQHALRVSGRPPTL
jgi:hypothetical protein